MLSSTGICEYVCVCVCFLCRLLPGKFIIWAAATMLIQAERKDSSAGVMTLPLAEKMTMKVLQEKASALPAHTCTYPSLPLTVHDGEIQGLYVYAVR